MRNTGKSVVSLHSIQGVLRRLQCDLKFHSRGFPLRFNPRSSNFTKLHVFRREVMPDDSSHHISLWSQAQLKSNLILLSARELESALYIKSFWVDTIFTSVDLTEFKSYLSFLRNYQIQIAAIKTE